MQDYTRQMSDTDVRAYLRQSDIDKYIERAIKTSTHPDVVKGARSVDEYLENKARQYARVSGGYGSPR